MSSKQEKERTNQSRASTGKDDDIETRADAFRNAKRVLPRGGAAEEERPPDSAYEEDEARAGSNGHDTTPDEKPVIHLVPGGLHETVAAAEAVMSRDVYLRGAALVRLGRAVEISREIKREDDQLVIVPVNAEYLCRELTRRASFLSFDKRAKKEAKWRSVDCPMKVATNIMAVAESPHWLPLKAIAHAPFLRADASICERPGYDAASGIYYQPSQRFPPIPQHPTKSDAIDALDTLLTPFEQFPFATPESTMVFIGHILTSVMRVVLATSPVTFYTAPTVAHGKSLLAKVVSLIATGKLPAMRPYSDSSEEQRKVLFGSLLAGDSELLIDNIPAGTRLKSPVLCAFATAEVYADRRLGLSDSTTLINTLTVSLTGNNITPTGDLARRSLICRLDIDKESARGRSFRIENLQSYVKENRSALLVAALTIIKAYAVAGRPKIAGIAALESFEDWSHAVRDALLWLDQADPVATQATDSDDEVDALSEVFRALDAFFNGEEFTSRKIVDAMGPQGAELHAALSQADCSEPSNVLSVGCWLNANKDRRVGEWKLKKREARSRSHFWRLSREK